MDKGTSLILAPQPNCPAVLVSAVHTASDFLKSAVLRNNSEKILTGYRLGWCTSVHSQRPTYRLGKRVSLARGIGANETCLVPAQEVIIGKERNASAVTVFFIAEVFLAGAKSWKVDLREIKYYAETTVTGN